MNETFYSMPVPVVIALLTDSHNMNPEPVIQSLKRQKPEIILIAGDIVNGEYGTEDGRVLKRQQNVLSLLRACTGIAPTYLSWGNHDRCLGPEDIKEIEKAGVTILDNTFIPVSLVGKQVVIGGLTSAWITDYRKRSEETDTPVYMLRKKGKDPAIPQYSWLQEYAAVPGYHILLSHHPEYLRFIPKEIELIVSGHAHGGQWRVLGRGLFAPGQGIFARMISGVIDGRLILSRGLSNPVRVPRLNNPTEIIYIMSEKQGV